MKHTFPLHTIWPAVITSLDLADKLGVFAHKALFR